MFFVVFPIRTLEKELNSFIVFYLEEEDFQKIYFLCALEPSLLLIFLCEQKRQEKT